MTNDNPVVLSKHILIESQLNDRSASQLQFREIDHVDADSEVMPTDDIDVDVNGFNRRHVGKWRSDIERQHRLLCDNLCIHAPYLIRSIESSI